MKPACLAGALTALFFAFAIPAQAGAPMFTDHYANDDGVKIHYVTAGDSDKPLVVMIHGYPDFWYTWRGLIVELRDQYRVAAMDTRGYNLSDKPEGIEAYRLGHLVKDVEAVIHAEGRKSAIIVGHDWGAMISWSTVLTRPDLVDRLVILSVPHPADFARELKTNPAQQAATAYAQAFQKPGSENGMTAETSARWVKDPAAKQIYIEAFRRSSFTAMMNYYRANYPPDLGDAVTIPQTPRIKIPVLVIYGMMDPYLLTAGHGGVWDHVDGDTTVLMLPGAGHFIEQDAGPLANRAIHDWLDERRVSARDQVLP